MPFDTRKEAIAASDITDVELEQQEDALAATLTLAQAIELAMVQQRGQFLSEVEGGAVLEVLAKVKKPQGSPAEAAFLLTRARMWEHNQAAANAAQNKVRR